MKKRAMSMLLVLLMVVTLFPTFVPAAAAADANGITNPKAETDESGNLHLTKTLAPGANGTYDIKMESWATGEVKAVEEKIPTDFVIVVDQSGSMSGEKGTDMPVGNPTRQDNKYLEDVAKGAYYVKDGENYYRVYGVKDYLFRFYPANHFWVGDIIERLGTSLRWFMGSTNATTTFQNQLYFREVVNGNPIYQPITMTVSGEALRYDIRFRYHSNLTNSDVLFNREDQTYMNGHDSPWYHSALGGVTVDDNHWRYDMTDGAYQGLPGNSDDTAYSYAEFTFIKGGMFVNYPMYDRHVGYTKLCYRDVNGVEHEVPSDQNGGQSTWEYCDDNGIARSQQEANSARPTYSGLYTFPTTTDRLTALKAALTEFSQEVAKETDSFGNVDNRVSIIGFSSLRDSVTHDPESYSTNNYNNTELLTKTDENLPSSTNGWQKATCDGDVSEYYGKGLVASNNGTAGNVNPKITAAINAITANGGTQPEDGLNMAYQVLTNRSDTTYTLRSGANKGQSVDRNTVVIFFTDGQPGNLTESNQYEEANDVVEQAKLIKDYKDTTIFSIGVFGESDGNPLTYSANNEWTKDTQNNDVRIGQLDPAYWEYLGGWMRSYPENNPQYCLRRQWRPNNAEGYTKKPNDTIYDYMSVVSSNYPDAQEFITQAWLDGNHTENYDHATNSEVARNKNTAETTNKYYRMASDQNTLIKAFLSAVTMNNEETNTGVKLDTTAIFKDTVNLADFDASGASFTAYSVDANTDGTFGTTAKENFTPQYNAATGELTVTGFDYSGKFVSAIHPGEKLIVKITGLAPKKTEGTLYSNNGNAGVYGKNVEDPTVSITSPTLELSTAAASKTYVIDFNAKMKVAEEATQLVGAVDNVVSGTNGNFVKSDTDVTYQLSSGNQASHTATINAPYTGVDTALVFGKAFDLETKDFAADAGWNKITTVPASSVYYDDSFVDGKNADGSDYTAPTVNVGDGSGYNADIGNTTSTGASENNGKFVFTFYGTGIDVYCTTHEKGGYVNAMVFRCSGESECTKTNRVGLKTIKNYSSEDYYNTPTVSFTGLEADTYTIIINANADAKYKLDGVRVYNPVKTVDAEGKATAAANELATTDEANANYFNLHTLLLNSTSNYTALSKKAYEGLPAEEATEACGVLYLDDASNIATTSNDENGDPQLIYTSLFDVYKANSPINEIYLSKNQGVAFELSSWSSVKNTAKVYLGLSAPNLTGEETYSGVQINNQSLSEPINCVDQYYDITDMVKDNGLVVIKNMPATGDGTVISLTNLKITCATLEQITGQNVPEEATNNGKNMNRLAFAPMHMSTVESIAEVTDPDVVQVQPEDPGQPGTPDQPNDPTPGGNDGAGSVQEMLKQLFESLLKNLFGLFKGLGNW